MNAITSIFLFSIIFFCHFAKAQTHQMLYGVTPSGGQNSKGVIFQYDLSTGIFTKKIDIPGGNAGGYPRHSLVRATDGNLYGFCENGGTHQDGVLFNYNPSTGIYSELFNLEEGSDGGYPNGSLMQASNGILYGMTSTGGSGGVGTLVSYSLTNGFNSVYSFNDSLNGSEPTYASLIQATDGYLYGMTRTGGNDGSGIIFRTKPWSGTGILVVFSFNFAITGGDPCGSLLQASDGNLYGMTSSGGSNGYGTLFQYNISSSTFTKKVDFDGVSKGAYPHGSLIQATDGMLYGMTTDGGIDHAGVLFKFDPTTSGFTKKYEFVGATGLEPYGSLKQASDGKLYGLTLIGGANNCGVLFQYDLASSNYTKKVDFETATKGSNPHGNLIELAVTVGIDEIDPSVRFEISPNPGHGTITVNFSDESKNRVMEIFNPLGEMVYTQSATKRFESINTLPFSSGLYFVKISNGNNFFTKNLLVQ